MHSHADSPRPGVHLGSPRPSPPPLFRHRRLGGRPSSFSPGKLRAICAFIEHDGLSDLAAGELAGVTRSTLSRWKLGSEEIAMQMEAARTRYLLPRLQQIEESRLRDGRVDWHAQAWLLKFSDPERYGRPSCRRRLREVEVPQDVARAAAEQAALVDLDLGLAGWREYRPGGTITPPMQRVLEIYREAGEELPIGPGAAESVAFPPETSASEKQARGEGLKSVAIPPETLACEEQASEGQQDDLVATHRRRGPGVAKQSFGDKGVTKCNLVTRSAGSAGTAEKSVAIPPETLSTAEWPSGEPRKSVTIPPETLRCASHYRNHPMPGAMEHKP